MDNSALLFGLIFPLAFILLEITINWLSLNPPKLEEYPELKTDHVLKIEYKKGTADSSYPTNTNVLMKTFCEEMTGINLKTRKSPFTFLGSDIVEVVGVNHADRSSLETSVGTQLCIGAVSANLTSIVQLLNRFGKDLAEGKANITDSGAQFIVLRDGAILLVVSVILLLVFAKILMIYKDSRTRSYRLSAIWITNIIGLVITFISFAVLGRLIA